MESANLTPLPPDRDPVDAWLSVKAPIAPLPDDGFSVRVLAALPPPNALLWRRPVLCLAGALAGLAFAWAQGAGWPDPMAIVRQGNQWATQVVRCLGDPWWSLTFAGASAAAAVTFAVRIYREPLNDSDD